MVVKSHFVALQMDGGSMALSVGVFLHDLGIHHNFYRSNDWSPNLWMLVPKTVFFTSFYLGIKTFSHPWANLFPLFGLSKQQQFRSPFAGRTTGTLHRSDSGTVQGHHVWSVLAMCRCWRLRNQIRFCFFLSFCCVIIIFFWYFKMLILLKCRKC